MTSHRSLLSHEIWLILSLLGFAIVAVSIVTYEYVITGAIVPGSAQAIFLEQDAFVTLSLVLIGLALAFVGFTFFLRTSRPEDASTSVVVAISSVLMEKKYARVFALSASVYGIFFALLSSTVVYQPEEFFSSTYSVHVPAVIPVVCCGGIGQMPQLIIYITEKFAVLLIPLNIVLLFTVSWLVGLNAAVATFSFDKRPNAAGVRWISGLGAITGVFTACPTCAGFFLLSILGLSGAGSLALTLGSLQGLFIIAGIPLLLVTPLLMSRRLDSCHPSASMPKRK